MDVIYKKEQNKKENTYQDKLNMTQRYELQ